MLTDNIDENPSYSAMVEMNSEIDNSNKGKKHGSRTIFGSYQLLRTIGEGEFGKVKLGVKLNTQSAVAIKLIKKKSVYNQNKLTKLCQEISILEKVNHPYIIKTYEVIEDNDYIGIIMEYASGGELFEYILAHRYLEEFESKKFFAQLLSGINYLHKNHLVHRDLKLENLLLDSIHNIVITDFGFATESHSDQNKLLTTSCGSPCYAAPELVVNDGYVGEAADIWSCGVILYAMLCGYLPFDDDPNNPDGENIHLLYKYILETKVSFPDYVSEEAKDLLRGILNPDPELRFTMEQIINHPWIVEFKEFILLEYDENNEAIIPMYDEMPQEMKQMGENNQDGNIKTLASQVFSSVSSSIQESNNNSNSVLDINDSQSQEENDDDDDDDDDVSETSDISDVSEDEEDEDEDDEEEDEEDDDDVNDNDKEDVDDVDDVDGEDGEDDDYFMDTKNNILPDASTIDTDQYIDFIKQSDCETTTSNIVNSEISDLIRPTPTIFKKDSYYTAQSMDLNQSSINTESHDEDDEELNLPSIPINTGTGSNFDDNITIPDSVTNYYTDHSDIYSIPLPSQPSELSIQKSKQNSTTTSSENDEENFLEQSNKTVTEKKKISEEKQKEDAILSNSVDQGFSPIYNSVLESSIDEIQLSVNNNQSANTSFSSASIKPKPRISSLPGNNNLMMTKKEELNTADDQASSIFSQTVVEAPIKSNENQKHTSVLEVDDDDDDKEKDKEDQSQCISKLENLSLKDHSMHKNDHSILKDDHDNKSIRSKTDISNMKIDNIKVSRSNISLSSRKRLSICTTSTINTSFYTPSSGKRLSSSVNLSLNDISIDNHHSLVGHSSLIITPMDSSSVEMKRYSLNAYKQSRNNLLNPNSSMISYTNEYKKSAILSSFMETQNKNNNNSKKEDKDKDKNKEPLMILDELKEDKKLSIVKPLTTSDLQLDAIESSSNSEMEQHPQPKLKSKLESKLESPSKLKLSSTESEPNPEPITEITSSQNQNATESKVKIDTENIVIIESNNDKPLDNNITDTDNKNDNNNNNNNNNNGNITPIKPPERELVSPRNPFIKYFNGIIDSKALTITPPFVTFLEMQKTLIDMNIEYRCLNNCFKIRCQKVFNTIASPEDLEALGKASPTMSPVHSPVSTPNISPSPLLHAKSDKTKKYVNDEVVTTSSQKLKSEDQISKCYSFHSHGSGKLKSLMTSIIDCAKSPSNSPSPANRSGTVVRQKRIFNLIKRKKNQSLVIFTMEICRIKNRDELYIIKFKRRKGDVWLFKDLYQQILSRLPLRT